ncbi:hypothetical protein L198_02245 [Cryptococcus wingfieldii CBS 7118]|uniref:Mei2-like C-terminal RNA recognition motif domain-containing protein n=1 Tax=Cryptococcus wingfieldii CBS 7118 TaxID=1295528 RepID=A0A1E3JR87_9TREE|nr:hypothetical protein L198_02245 [Cryptococcus wingfieldii CBS 7118]ODO03398.1 hypothetical protein L198_02245 [Cryptococcus wingfieldii CBS 7118]
MASPATSTAPLPRQPGPHAIPIMDPADAPQTSSPTKRAYQAMETPTTGPSYPPISETTSKAFSPDISKLKIEMTEDDGPSPFWGMGGASLGTLNKRQDGWAYQTPRRFSIPRSSSPSPGLTTTPYTPQTRYSARSAGIGTPVTPYTPDYPTLDYRRHSETSDAMHRATQKPFNKPVEEEYTAQTLGRYLLITNVPMNVRNDDFRDMIQNIAEFKALIVKHLQTKGCVIVAFHDPRENLKVYQRLQAGPINIGSAYPSLNLSCMPVTKDLVESVTGHGPAWEEVWKTSEAVVRIDIDGGNPVNPDAMHRVVGAIAPYQSIEPIGYDCRSYVVDFFDTRDAATCIRTLDGHVSGQAYVSADYYDPTPRYAPTRPTLGSRAFSLGSAAFIPGSLGLPKTDSYSDVFSLGHSAESTGVHTPSSATFNRLRSDDDIFTSRSASLSPTKREVSASGPAYNAASPWARRGSTPAVFSGADTPPRMLSLSRRLSEAGTVQGLVNKADITARARQRQGLGGHWDANDRKSIPEQNRVFPERIVAGLDHRTTVMIKDVPNKLSRQELVEILDEVVPSEFDFVYLRFDFKNCCNVGYAFVNFCSVSALVRFIQARVGKKWNMFSSEKVLQVSYADIQGKAALINKFKNSAVMSVVESWRPQIFYSSGSMKGQPEPFPVSDNLSLRERSGAGFAGENFKMSWPDTANKIIQARHPATFSESHERPYEYAQTCFDHGF